MLMDEFPVQSVSQVTRELKELVEGNFPRVAVLGEVSNFTRAGSGHLYLTLKDEAAQLRAVVWRSQAARLKFEIADGLEVVAVGRVELYQGRGSLQLIVDQLTPRGVGALELAFRQLQEKLAAEGLFEAERKRPLPRFPKRIALVTSPTSAAVRDMLQVITRRWPAADVVILPVAVQGPGAAEEIAAALRRVHTIPGVDVVVTGRGGGSLEDLWAFNEEIVARAIAACRLPVISAVGHEIDVSIADLVADRRALTPSEAGELVVPLHAEVVAELKRLRERTAAALSSAARTARLRLEALAHRGVFSHPLEFVHDRMTLVDEQERALSRAVEATLERNRGELAVVAASLDALSPLRVLRRGYSVTRKADDGRLVRETTDVERGETIETLLESARILSTVESISPRDDDADSGRHSGNREQ
jgi:exodeoxyribonuclease VII large subunit